MLPNLLDDLFTIDDHSLNYEMHRMMALTQKIVTKIPP